MDQLKPTDIVEIFKNNKDFDSIATNFEYNFGILLRDEKDSILKFTKEMDNNPNVKEEFSLLQNSSNELLELVDSELADIRAEFDKTNKAYWDELNGLYGDDINDYYNSLFKSYDEINDFLKLKEEIEELEEFFYSDWFSTLSHGKDPDSILDKLKEAIDDN